jgi:hypothetical protein
MRMDLTASAGWLAVLAAGALSFLLLLFCRENMEAAPAAAARRRLGRLSRHVRGDVFSGATSVEESLRRLPGGDGPGDPGIPAAADPDATMSVYLLMGQSSMAGRGMLPEFQTLNPDILGAPPPRSLCRCPATPRCC